MSTFDIATKIEEITISLWGLSSLVVALQDAIFHGSFAPDAYEGALFVLQQSIRTLETDTQGLADQVYQKAREGE